MPLEKPDYLIDVGFVRCQITVGSPGDNQNLCVRIGIRQFMHAGYGYHLIRITMNEHHRRADMGDSVARSELIKPVPDRALHRTQDRGDRGSRDSRHLSPHQLAGMSK